MSYYGRRRRSFYALAISSAMFFYIAAEGCGGDKDKPACVVGKIVAREDAGNDMLRIRYLDGNCREVSETISGEQDRNSPYGCTEGTYPDHAAAGSRRGKVITFPDCLEWRDAGQPGIREPTSEPRS